MVVVTLEEITIPGVVMETVHFEWGIVVSGFSVVFVPVYCVVVGVVSICGVVDVGVPIYGVVVVPDTLEQGTMEASNTFLHVFPSSYVPSGQPHPSTIGPLQHLSSEAQIGFGCAQVCGTCVSA